MKKNKTIVIIALALIAILILSTILFLFMPRKVNFVSDPDGAQFLLNSDVYITPKTLRLRPGNYKITAHNPGFADQTYDIKVRYITNDPISIRLVSLPLEKAIEEVEKQTESYVKEQGELSQLSLEELAKKYPLTKYLPYMNDNILFDYYIRDNKIYYFIEALPNKSYDMGSYYKEINDFIKSKGIDPVSIQIEWK